MIVTDANELVRALQGRMPVILAPTDYAAWIDPRNKDTAALPKLLRPADPDLWELRQVWRKVNSPRNDSPDLLEPVATSYGAHMPSLSAATLTS